MLLKQLKVSNPINVFELDLADMCTRGSKKNCVNCHFMFAVYLYGLVERYRYD